MRIAVVFAAVALTALFGCENRPSGEPKAQSKAPAETAKVEPTATPDDGEPVGVYLPRTGDGSASKPRKPLPGEPFADYDSATVYKGKASERVFTPPPSTATPTEPTRPPGKSPTVLEKVAKAAVPVPPVPKEHAPDKTVPQWIEQVKTGDAKQRAQAIFALARAGADAKPALPVIKAALKDKDETVRAAAEFALKRIPF
jgi:hypothetical protein